MEAERQHYNVTLAILTLAGIAFALQQTMVIPALPALQRDLHTTTTWVTWVSPSSCSWRPSPLRSSASSATSTEKSGCS